MREQTYIGKLMVFGALCFIAQYSFAVEEQCWNYTYNSFGSIRQQDGPRVDVEDITTTNYNSDGFLTSVTNALGHKRQFLSHTVQGKPQRVVDANQQITNISYDSSGNALTVTLPAPTGSGFANLVTYYTYDAVNQLTDMAFPNGQTLQYAYDDARRLVAIIAHNGDRIDFTLDDAGNITHEQTSDASGAITKTLGRAYDELSRLMNIVGAETQTTELQYDTNDNLTSITNPRTFENQQEYDSLNRLIKVIDPLLQETTLGYDNQGNLTSVTDAESLSTQYEYDAFGNVIKLTSPDTGVTDYVYDEAGNRTTVIDNRGIIAQYQYDALNRLTNIHYPNNPGEGVSYSYDDSSTGNYGIGRLTGIQDASGDIHYQYDYLGRIQQKDIRIQSQHYRFSYQYNSEGQLASITYPSGRIVHYHYDTLGRITGVTTQSNSAAVVKTVLNNIQYLPFGPATEWVYGNGLGYSAQYDQDYRLRNLQLQDTALKMSRTYNYDPNSNISDINQTTELNPSIQHDYSYDELDRLTHNLFGSNAIQYSYDSVGNRLSRTFESDNSETQSESYSYAENSHHLQSVNATDSTGTATRTFGYDDNGNQIADSGKNLSLEYNDGNRPFVATVNGSTITYIHNSMGQRTVKTINNQITHYHYGERGQLLAESYDSGTFEKEYLYLGGQVIAVLIDDNVSYFGPTVSIQQPTNNSTYTHGASVTFSATAIDTENSDISTSIIWASNLDGNLGTGASLTLNNLTGGRHIITAQVSNANSQIGRATMAITLAETNTVEDTDGDGLSDAWEQLYFQSLGQNAEGDFDGDGVLNSSEHQAGTNPTDGMADSDYDSLPDSWEIQYFGSVSENPSEDSDSDGINNEDEFRLGLNPADGNKDSDGDQMGDAWEIQYFTDLQKTAEGDEDADTLVNLTEFIYQFNPLESNVIFDGVNAEDTDNDGLGDHWEQFYFGNLQSTGAADTDSDTYTNAIEYMYGTNPLDSASGGVPEGDVDVDGLPDSWEVEHFGSLQYSSFDDPDGDSFSNGEELSRDWNPNENDLPRITAILLIL